MTVALVNYYDKSGWKEKRMKIVSMNCPNCGGTVKITDDQNSCICPYCDSALTIDDGKFHIVDEAKIKEIEFEKQKYQDELLREEKRKERRESWKKKLKQWVLIEMASFFIVRLINSISHAKSLNILRYMAVPFIMIFVVGFLGGPVYLAFIRPDVDYERNNPPYIKSKLLFCIVLMLIEFFVFSVIGRLLNAL